MRNVARTARNLFFGVSIALAGALIGGAAQAADQRIIVTPDADYTGFDYETVKDVTLDACKSSCLDAGQCKAFTYNVKAQWCFLKSDFGILSIRPAPSPAGSSIRSTSRRASKSGGWPSSISFPPTSSTRRANSPGRSAAASTSPAAPTTP